MSALDEVKSYMKFWGWTDGGGPGSVKLGLKGEVLAKHGDANWVRDVENACNTAQPRLGAGEPKSADPMA